MQIAISKHLNPGKHSIYDTVSMVSDIKIEWFIWDTEWLQRFVLETGDATLDQGARERQSLSQHLFLTGLLSTPRMATNPQPNSQSDTDNNGS